MEVSVKCEARHICIRLSGELDHHSAKGLLRRLDQEIEKALPTQLTLDLSGVTFMDSSGIAVALHTLQQVKRLGGKMWIANPSQQAKKVFFAAGIQRMIGMEDAYEK